VVTRFRDTRVFSTNLQTATLKCLKLSAIAIIIPIVKMNWTGGTLQRLKAGRQNGVLQKQKEHFAKMRARLQNAPNSSAPPFFPSYIKYNDLNQGGRLSSFSSGTVRHVGHSKRLQQDRRDREESYTASNIRYIQGTDTHHAVEGTSSRRKSRYGSASPTNSGKPLTYSPISPDISSLLTDASMQMTRKGRERLRMLTRRTNC